MQVVGDLQEPFREFVIIEYLEFILGEELEQVLRICYNRGGLSEEVFGIYFRRRAGTGIENLL